MTHEVLVQTRIRISPVVRKEPTGWWVGWLKEYPGIISQSRTRHGLIQNLIRLVRDIAKNEPESLGLFR
jgi:hypothetical protein